MRIELQWMYVITMHHSMGFSFFAVVTKSLESQWMNCSLAFSRYFDALATERVDSSSRMVATTAVAGNSLRSTLNHFSIQLSQIVDKMGEALLQSLLCLLSCDQKENLKLTSVECVSVVTSPAGHPPTLSSFPGTARLLEICCLNTQSDSSLPH